MCEKSGDTGGFKIEVNDKYIEDHENKKARFG